MNARFFLIPSFLVALVCAGLGCGSANKKITLTGQFQTTVQATTTNKEFSCQTTIFPKGQDTVNLLVLPTTHFIPVDASGIPQNNFQIQIVNDAIFKANGTMTVQITCSPTGQSFIGTNFLDVFIGETDFTGDGCGTNCELNVSLNNFLDQQFISTLSCSSLNFIEAGIILLKLCDPSVDPNSLGCTTQELVIVAAANIDCPLVGAPVDNCGNGTCDSGETNASCPADCPCNSDGTCDSGETDANCHADCHCGNGTCDAGETDTTCHADCHCGNGACDAGETNASCPGDCNCGDEVIDASEQCDGSASVDACSPANGGPGGTCQACECCGDGFCGPGETPVSCIADCSPGPPPPGP